MSDPIAMTRQLAVQGARLAWYTGLNWIVDRRADALGAKPAYRPQRPVPTRQELTAELGRLLLSDAAAVRDGLYPAMTDAADRPSEHFSRMQAMLADLPGALDRRQSEEATSARTLGDTRDLPEYFTQDFHFQTGGYLTEESAKLYDIQVETLFMGSAGPMRRTVLKAVAEYMRGRDQRTTSLLDIACGTGRFLRQARLTYPALRLMGLDLSKAYLSEAEHQMAGLRGATWLAANAEAIPLPDASQDLVTCIFMFHELPPDVRRTVTAEVARVLKPGGRFIFLDSLQMGDRPGWDGLLEAFPVRFHEPYYRHYTIDDLDSLFAGHGLAAVRQELPFMSKLMVRERQ